MDNIYDKVLETIEKGGKVTIHIPDKILVCDNEILINKGEYTLPLGLDKVDRDECIEMLEHKFRMFEHSIPSERSEKARYNWFQPLKEKDLDDADMLFGVRRDFAKADLEAYTLISILNGSLYWDNLTPYTWFWVSPNYPHLILFKDWMS